MAEITKVALKVDNNNSFPNNNAGAITPTILRAFNTNMIDSLVDEIGYTLDSGSWNKSINALNVFTASATGLTTGSLLTTASAAGNVITFTKGNNTTFNVTVATGSSVDISSLNQATASLQAFTQSANIRLNNLETTTASLNTSVSNINTFTASTAISLTNLNQSSASQQISIDSINSKTGSYATTGSNTFTSANTFTSISASSFISASEFIGNGAKITNITASIALPILDEGIPQGNAFSMNFTGSAISAIIVGGTAVVSVNVPDTGSFNALTASFNTYTASTDAKFVAVGASTASLNSFTASFNSNTFVGTASFNSYTSSNNQRVSSLETNSASVNISISALNQFTASQSTASLVTSITNLNSFTSSQLTINTAIGASTSSLNTATASLFTSASLGLTTASFSGNTLTFTKGNGNTFGVVIPDVSGSTINTGSFATTGSNSFIGNQTITGSLTISSSAAVDLIITGTARITDVNGLARLAMSPASFNVDATATVSTPGEGYIFGPTGSDASFYLGVYDDPNFTTDIELKLKADSNGLSFNDWDNVTAADYVPFMTLTPNIGNNPAPLMTRGLQVTGSTQVQNFTASLQQGFTYVGNASGRTTTVATSSFGTPIPTGTISGSSQITSLGFVSSSVTASSLITASFSGNTLTFTKGDASTFGVVIPDVSGSTINTGSFVTTSSFNAYTASQSTGSLMKTGSVSGNVLTFTKGDATTFSLTVATGSSGGAAFPYTGSAEITGSLGITGSFRGYVNALSVASSTASIDMNNGNFFTLNLPTSSTTHITMTNIKAGQTINLQVSQSSANTGSIAFAPNIKFAGGFDYTATPITGALDLVSFITFDAVSIIATSVKNLL